MATLSHLPCAICGYDEESHRFVCACDVYTAPTPIETCPGDALITAAPEAATPTTTHREEVIKGLRELADFLAEHPEVKEPFFGTANAFVDTKEEMAVIARSATWRKVWLDAYFVLVREFSGGIALDVNIMRDRICERIVTGTRVVPATPERVEEVVEWKCDGSLLGEATP